jgi:hypothetical protein
MCEPYHSIVQYPVVDEEGRSVQAMLAGQAEDMTTKDDDEDTPEGPKGTGSKSKPQKLSWIGRILEWLHYSKLGSGHSEAIRIMGRFSSLIPPETRYECAWWERTTRVDAPFARSHNNGGDYGLALGAASEYAKRVCTGSLSLLRRFLEVSIRRSKFPEKYLTTVAEQLLVPSGRDEMVRRLRGALALKNKYNNNLWTMFGSRCYNSQGTDRKTIIDRAVKVIIGITRQRKLMVSPWSDDDSLWLPDTKIILG